MTTLLLAVLLLIILSGIFSGTEAALFSINTNKARQLNAQGHISDSFLKIIEERDNYVNTLVFLNNIVNIAGSVFLGGMAITVLGSTITNLVFTPLLTALIIIFAEMLPKNGCVKKPNRVVGMMNPVLRVSRTLLFPLVFVATKITEWIIFKLLGDVKEEPISEDEIAYMAKEGAKDTNSEIRDNEAKIIQRAFHLVDLKAADIMTPRVRLSWIDENETLDNIFDFVKDCEHSRIIVANKTVDEFVGVAMKDDLLIAKTENKGQKTIKDLGYINVKTVGENTTAEALLRIFQKEKKLIAVVKDSYGGVAGVVTMEDVLEILVGEIVDETDTVEDLREDTIAKKREKLNAVNA